MNNLAGRQPVALVVGHKDFTLEAYANAIGCAKAVGQEFDFTRFPIDPWLPFTVFDLWIGACSSRLNGSSQGSIEIAVFVFQTKTKFVEIGRNTPIIT